MQATHSTAEKQLAKTGTNLAASIAAVATLERDLKTAGAKFAFLQDTRAYIADLCDMLQVPCMASCLPADLQWPLQLLHGIRRKVVLW